jgi:hypothetical protein
MNDTRPTTFGEQFPDIAEPVENEPGTKERVIFILKSLLELVENDRIRVDKMRYMTVDEILNMAEREANKAVEGSQRLKDL